jgi:hypothetical protein
MHSLDFKRSTALERNSGLRVQAPTNKFPHFCKTTLKMIIIINGQVCRRPCRRVATE